MIRLAIVSDIRLYREGLAEILDREESISISGTAQTINHAITEISMSSPDVVLLDMTMIASCDALDSIASTFPEIKLVTLAITEDEDTILACAKAGVSGYVSREASINELVDTVRGVVDGEHYCPRRIAASLFNKLKTLPDINAMASKTMLLEPNESKATLLTKREKQIFILLSDGLSNKQIACKLTIEVSTVKNHVHNILTKIGVHTRLHAVQLLQNQVLAD